MAEKRLTLSQQIALLAVSIPDSVLDFMEDFNFESALQSELVRSSFDESYLRDQGDSLKADLEKIRQTFGKVEALHMELAGTDLPNGFICKLTCEKGVTGLGILTKVREKTIARVIVSIGEFSDESLKKQLRILSPAV